MYRQSSPGQLSFENFYLPFAGKPFGGEIAWVKLAEIIPWEEFEELAISDVAGFCFIDHLSGLEGLQTRPLTYLSRLQPTSSALASIPSRCMLTNFIAPEPTARGARTGAFVSVVLPWGVSPLMHNLNSRAKMKIDPWIGTPKCTELCL